ncbi:universal stress protein [Ilumatobacter nonamiensis]|uniref:universal stress protein n=1 Tax=Ilumatobacter nonamiensis TaxID=467093 RepID=UPI00130DF345|nr:universal stress protein [Ilumatobacter nonamiensis]
MSERNASPEQVSRWMVGVDGSHNAASALRWAVAAAAEMTGDVVPVCVWHVPLPIFALAGRRAIDVDRAGIEASTNVAATASIEMAAEEHGAGFEVGELSSVEGHPSEVLVDLTGDGDAVVVGRRGIGQIRHRLLGSVSRDLATNARGPVVIVPDGWEPRPIRSVVVGFDGSDHAKAALAWTLANAPTEARVEALIAIDLMPWLQPELVLERHGDDVAAAEDRIRAAAAEVDPDGRAAQRIVLHSPKQALAEAMSDADLVVVGPRGMGAIGRSVLGSVTTWLLQDAACPVAVVPS